MESNESLLNNDLQIDPASHGHLNESAKWAKFVAIAGFIFSISILLFAIYYVSLLAKLRNSFGGSRMETSAILVLIFYLLISIVWFIISVFQLRFATKLQAALQVNDQVELNSAFQNLRSYYRMSGIVTIIMLVFTVLAFIGILSRTGNVF